DILIFCNYLLTTFLLFERKIFYYSKEKFLKNNQIITKNGVPKAPHIPEPDILWYFAIKCGKLRFLPRNTKFSIDFQPIASVVFLYLSQINHRHLSHV